MRSVRFRLLVAVILIGAALAFRAYRTRSRLLGPASSSLQPILSADVPLSAPPPLPSDGFPRMQAGLRQVRDLQMAARARSSDLAAHLRVAQAATPVGDLLTACDEIQAAIGSSSQPPPAAVLDVLARCQAQLGLFSSALRTYGDLIARAPADATGYVGLSRVQYLHGEREAALKTLERGVSAVPAGDERGRLALANEFEARAEIRRALELAQSAAGAAPEDPSAAVAVARLLGKMGRLAEARTLLEKVLAAHPDNAEALGALADLRLNPLLPQNDPASVEQSLLLAGQHDPHNAASFLRLGGFYQDHGQYHQAAYVYGKLLAIASDSAAGRLQLAYAYSHLGENQAGAEQERIAQQLLARDKEEALLTTRRDAHPTDPATRTVLAKHYMGAGQFPQALTELQAAYCLSPGSDAIRRELTAFYRKFGLAPPTLPNAPGKCACGPSSRTPGTASAGTPPQPSPS